MSLKLPKNIEVELVYAWMDGSLVYEFPRLRKKDADMDEAEKLAGQGRKMKPSSRLAKLLVNVQHVNADGQVVPEANRLVEGRREGEGAEAFADRIERTFSSEEFQELAEDALLYRLNAIYPRALFRSGADSRVAVNLGSEKGAAGA